MTYRTLRRTYIHISLHVIFRFISFIIFQNLGNVSYCYPRIIIFDNGIFEALLHIDNVSIRISCFKHWLLEQQWDILTLIEISFFVNIFLFSFLSSCQALTWDGLWSHCWEQSNKNIFMNIIAQDQTHLSHLTKSNIISCTRIKKKKKRESNIRSVSS